MKNTLVINGHQQNQPLRLSSLQISSNFNNFHEDEKSSFSKEFKFNHLLTPPQRNLACFYFSAMQETNDFAKRLFKRKNLNRIDIGEFNVSWEMFCHAFISYKRVVKQTFFGTNNFKIVKHSVFTFNQNFNARNINYMPCKCEIVAENIFQLKNFH